MFHCCRPVLSPARSRDSDISIDGDNESLPDALIAEKYRSNSDMKILQRGASMGRSPSLGKKTKSKSQAASPPPRSLFEASAQRAAAHTSSLHGEPDEDHGGVPDTFLEAYIEALRDGNATWATEPLVADLFARDVKMTGQDQKTTVGKARVLQRLNQGVEMLIKMAGNNATAPTWDVKGPVFTEEKRHQYKCTIKRGALKFSFLLEFLIVNGKIKQLSNSRV